MDTTNDVSHLFSMDREKFLNYQERLKDVGIDPDLVRRALNVPAAIESAGRQSIGIGAVSLALALVVAITVFLTQSVSAFSTGKIVGGGGVMLLIMLGTWRISEGLRQWRHSRALRDQARKAAMDLEGDDGFLWRFEPFLADWDGFLPDEVANSLGELCLASKAGVIPEGHYLLRAYWYWVNALDGRMKTARREMGW